MPLPLPNLDDRTFETLYHEMIEMLPRTNSDWTSRNSSDPGVMILELFAYLVEMDIFQLNRLTSESYAKLLKLVGVDIDWKPGTSTPPGIINVQEVQTGIELALKKLTYKRAISQDDIVEIINEFLTPLEIASRAYCLSNRDFSRFEYDPEVAEFEKEGHMLILLWADTEPWLVQELTSCSLSGQINRSLKRYTLKKETFDGLKERLHQRRVLTTRLHLARPTPCKLILQIRVIPEKGVDPILLAEKVKANLFDFYCPVWGGQEKRGYAPGREFKVSEAIEAVENTEGVDYTSYLMVRHFEAALGEISQVYTPKYYEQIWMESILVDVASEGEEA